jgi:hypothetical protein
MFASPIVTGWGCNSLTPVLRFVPRPRIADAAAQH